MEMIGHNNPPNDAEILRETLEANNSDLIKRAEDLIAAADRAPDSIEDDETKAKITDFLGSIAKCEKAVYVFKEIAALLFVIIGTSVSLAIIWAWMVLVLSM